VLLMEPAAVEALVWSRGRLVTDRVASSRSLLDSNEEVFFFPCSLRASHYLEPRSGTRCCLLFS